MLCLNKFAKIKSLKFTDALCKKIKKKIAIEKETCETIATQLIGNVYAPNLFHIIVKHSLLLLS